ncbi:hypothetical protein IHO40_00170 [Wolbachia endosymbiont of Mansonella ozzardi]|uniref:hypothetical protein n=1 Tax=Wolbachia endosymbiont of Mansonella ozzardi TaxID=137464 RepID=UPI001CE07097|nr:hypothetical protein [Wolbachia endosymbiont of Mansonella ozzardi]MCA4774608.1 hypothetical protein [Wolbachia endosymbiont of Mansonella ozzardi]
MEDQAKSKKESARYNSVGSIIPGVFLSVGLGAGSALAGPSGGCHIGRNSSIYSHHWNSCWTGHIFLSHDYKTG